METQQVIFARHSNGLAGDAPFSSQRALNMYAEAGQADDYSQLIMRHSSGLRPVHDFGSPVRALACIADKFYAAAAGKLWEINADETVTELGDIVDDECTFISGNRTQVGVTAGGAMYVYDGAAVALATGNNAPGNITTMDYLDGFGIVTLEDSDQFFVTNLTDFDNINALDFASSESKPDRNVRVLVDHREIWLFGTKTIEVFYNDGGADFPFTRANEASLERGVVGKFTPTKLENTVYWLGEDLEIKKADGYVPTRISTHALERHIHDMTPEQREQIRCFIHREEGHKFLCVWFPHRAAWLYDVTTGMWHERSATDGPWLATMAEHAHGQNWAGSNRGVLYRFERDFYHDHDVIIRRQLVTPPVHFGEKRFSALYMSLDLRAGWSDLDHEPQVHLSLSKDRGHTWYSKGVKGMGLRGQFNQLLRWWGIGLARELYAKIEVRDPVALSIYAAHVAYNVGKS